MPMIEQKAYFLFLAFLVFIVPVFIKVIELLKKYSAPSLRGNFNFRISARSVIVLALKTAAFILAVVSLAGPLTTDKTLKEWSEGGNIVFALDISKSMLCEDLRPSRLEKAKSLISGILKDSVYDRAGLIVFASRSVFVCPLTDDHEALADFMASVTTDMVPSGGSSLRSGLENAVAAVKRDAKAKWGTIVLISDGEDLEGDDYRDILEDAKKSGINILTVGAGTAEGGQIPQYFEDFFGKSKHYLKYRGETVITKLEERTLRDIAEATGGKYCHISKAEKQLKKELDSLKRRSLRQRDVFMMKNDFGKVLSASLILYALSVIITII